VDVPLAADLISAQPAPGLPISMGPIVRKTVIGPLTVALQSVIDKAPVAVWDPLIVPAFM
jgi:hypothetical protein